MVTVRLQREVEVVYVKRTGLLSLIMSLVLRCIFLWETVCCEGNPFGRRESLIKVWVHFADQSTAAEGPVQPLPWGSLWVP